MSFGIIMPETTIELSKSTDQNVADVPIDDLVSREELLKKLDRQIEWEEANAIPYEDSDVGCILGLKKARKYVKLASSTEKPNANDCDLISRADAIEAVMAEGRNVHASEYANAERIIHEADAVEALAMLPSAETTGALDDAIAKYVADGLLELPSADRPKGEWKWTHGGQCSECGFHNSNFDFNFCPSCGADMRGEDDG